MIQLQLAPAKLHLLTSRSDFLHPGISELIFKQDKFSLIQII